MRLNQLTEGWLGHINVERTCRVMLDPLAEIVVAMLMAIGISSGQFMVHVLCNRERRKGHQ